MPKLLTYIFVLIVCLNCVVQCAKILAVFPYPAAAQYYTAKPFLNELAKRGHRITLISHQFPDGTRPSIRLNYPDFDEIVTFEIMRSERSHERKKPLLNYHENVTRLVLENAEVKRLMKKKNVTFDLMIVDTLMPTAIFALAEHFKAHLIGLSAETTELHIDRLVGNESPISYVPLSTSGSIPPMTFVERVQNFYFATAEWFALNVCESTDQQRIFKRHFPHLNKTLREIYRSFSLILLNQHFSIGVARPYVPNMVEVGGLFKSERLEPIPADVLAFIENSPRGVVYFSLGANIKLKYLPDKIKIEIDTFIMQMEYRILWKVDDFEQMEYVPTHCLARTWFPQRAILAHPKVNLFITQVGYLSVMEAIIYGKPIVGVPILNAHLNNMKRVEHYKIGLAVNYTNFEAATLIETVKEVLKDPNCTRNVRRLRRRFLDRLQKPIDLAVFWTEYVLRHDGAVFMRVPGRKLNWITYANLDVLLFMAAFLAMSLYLQTCCILRCQFAVKCFWRALRAYWINRNLPESERYINPRDIPAFPYTEDPDENAPPPPTPPARFGVRRRRRD